MRLLLLLLAAASFRRVDFTEQAFARFVREIYQRLDRLEGGQTNRGRASFEDTIRVGPIEINCKLGTGNIAGHLDGAILAGDNSLVLREGQSNEFPDAPFTIAIGNEQILVLGMDIPTDTFSPLGRGYNGTFAAGHADNALVLLAGSDVVVFTVRNTITGRERLVTVIP